MLFYQQQCPVFPLIPRKLTNRIQHRPILGYCFIKGVQHGSHSISLFLFTELYFSTLGGHLAEIQPADLVEYPALVIALEVPALFLDISKRTNRVGDNEVARFLPDLTDKGICIGFALVLTSPGETDLAFVVIEQQQLVSNKNDTSYSDSYKFVHIFIVVFRI